MATAAAAATLLVAAPAAQASTIVHEYSAAQVNSLVRDTETFNSAACGFFDWPFDVACEAAAANQNGGMLNAFRSASDRGCGVRMTVVATGSGNSWDRSTSSYVYTGSGCMKG